MWGVQGAVQTPFGFAGEPTDQNDLVHLRARYYNPVLGGFPSLDPLEGCVKHPVSLNQYAYVQGNPINFVDHSGMIYEKPQNSCSNRSSTCIQEVCSRYEEDKCTQDDYYYQCLAYCENHPNSTYEPEYFNDAHTGSKRANRRMAGLIVDFLESIIPLLDRCSQCIKDGTLVENFIAVLEETLSPQSRVKSRGYLGTLEGDVAAAVGVSAFWLHEGDSCRIYAAGELGIGLAADIFGLPAQISGAKLWSTAGLDDIAGFSYNISGDIPPAIAFSPAGFSWQSEFLVLLPELVDNSETLLPMVTGIGLGLSFGSACNISAYSGIPGGAAISLTGSYTIPIADCSTDGSLDARIAEKIQTRAIGFMIGHTGLPSVSGIAHDIWDTLVPWAND